MHPHRSLFHAVRKKEEDWTTGGGEIVFGEMDWHTLGLNVVRVELFSTQLQMAIVESHTLNTDRVGDPTVPVISKRDRFSCGNLQFQYMIVFSAISDLLLHVFLPHVFLHLTRARERKYGERDPVSVSMEIL